MMKQLSLGKLKQDYSETLTFYSGRRNCTFQM